MLFLLCQGRYIHPVLVAVNQPNLRSNHSKVQSWNHTVTVPRRVPPRGPRRVSRLVESWALHSVESSAMHSVENWALHSVESSALHSVENWALH
jgi:hypothetical protein